MNTFYSPCGGGSVYDLSIVGCRPIVVGIVIELFSHWLDEKDKDDN
ncbi:type I toxin-antitoxin system Fst family toxin [Enterococcus casseliflavus]